jgi:hypothetical protein
MPDLPESLPEPCVLVGVTAGISDLSQWRAGGIADIAGIAVFLPVVGAMVLSHWSLEMNLLPDVVLLRWVRMVGVTAPRFLSAPLVLRALSDSRWEAGGVGAFECQ